jgi:hypothetical protein
MFYASYSISCVEFEMCESVGFSVGDFATQRWRYRVLK